MKRYDEIEIKLRVTSRREMEERLTALRFNCVQPRVRERNVLYDFKDGSLTKNQRALRLRSAGGKHWVTFKGRPQHSRNYKIREEIETAVADAEKFAGILSALGLHPVFTYEKYRTTYMAVPARGLSKPPAIALDETSAGDYVELEGPRAWIDRIASQLGYIESDYITSSYVSLLLGAAHGRSRPAT